MLHSDADVRPLEGQRPPPPGRARVAAQLYQYSDDFYFNKQSYIITDILPWPTAVDFTVDVVSIEQENTVAASTDAELTVCAMKRALATQRVDEQMITAAGAGSASSRRGATVRRCARNKRALRP